MNALSIQEELNNTRAILEAAGIGLSLSGEPRKLGAPPLVQNILGLCLREAINNVVKHSRADTCSIFLGEDTHELTLSVTDNGPGAEIDRPAGVSSGRGLLGMKERLELIQGTLTYSSVPGKGTTLSVKVPKVVKNQQLGGVS
ncbi:Sensor histidine kinase DesK [compost metagenome]